MDRHLSKTTRSRGNHDHGYLLTRVTLVVFKLIGLAPLKIVEGHSVDSVRDKNNFHSSRSIKFVYSRLGLFYNVLLAIIVLATSLITLRRPYVNDYPYKTPLTTTIEMTQAVFSITIIILLFLSSFMKQRTMIKLLNRLLNLDAHITRLADSRKIVFSRFYFICIFATNSIIWFLVIVTDRLTYRSALLDWFNDILPAMIVSWFILQYALMIELLQNEFRNFNRSLIHASASSSIVTKFRSFVQTEMSLIENDYSPKIIVFRRIHGNLCEIANDISEFYSLPILLAIALTSFSIVYNSYFAILPFVLAMKTNPTMIIVNSLLWLLGLVLPIIVLTTSVNATINQMRKTADAIHKVFGRSNISREDQSELKQFLIELLQRKVYFTAYGLFSLDCTLVHSIISMVVTYLIILFQFQISGTRNDTRTSLANITIEESKNS